MHTFLLAKNTLGRWIFLIYQSTWPVSPKVNFRHGLSDLFACLDCSLVLTHAWLAFSKPFFPFSFNKHYWTAPARLSVSGVLIPGVPVHKHDSRSCLKPVLHCAVSCLCWGWQVSSVKCHIHTLPTHSENTTVMSLHIEEGGYSHFINLCVCLVVAACDWDALVSELLGCIIMSSICPPAALLITDVVLPLMRCVHLCLHLSSCFMSRSLSASRPLLVVSQPSVLCLSLFWYTEFYLTKRCFLFFQSKLWWKLFVSEQDETSKSILCRQNK